MRLLLLLPILPAWLGSCVDASPPRQGRTAGPPVVVPSSGNRAASPSPWLLGSCPELDRIARRFGFRRPERTGERVEYARGGIDCDQDVLTITLVTGPIAPSTWSTRAAPHLREAVGPVSGGAASVTIETIDEADAWEDEAISALRAALVACDHVP